MSLTSVPPSLSDNPAILRIYGAHPLHTDGDPLALAFAADGTLWSVEDSGVLRHWDLAGQQLLEWHHLEELATLWAFNPNAALVAAGSDSLTVWDVASGDLVKTLTWSLKPRWITAIAFHPTRRLIATGHDDRQQRLIPKTTEGADHGPVKFQHERRKHRIPNPGMVRVWDIEEPEPICKFTAPHAAISALAFSPDGTKLAAADERCVIHLWDLKSGDSCGEIAGGGGRIPALVWHPDGKRLVSAGWDTNIRVWDVQTREPIILLNSQDSQVQTLVFNRDGSRLVCSDLSNTVHIWDMNRYRSINVLHLPAKEIHSLAISTDSATLAVGGADRVVHVYDVQQRGEQAAADPQLSRTAIAVCAGGNRLASLGAGTALRVWDTASGESVLSLENARLLRGFAASPDGKWFAASLADEEAPAETATLGLWHAATGKRLRMLDGPKPPITALAFSADSTHLASSGYQAADVWLWDIPSGEPILLIPNATNGCSVEALAWHSQGRLLACAGVDWLPTGGSDGQVTIWDVQVGKQVFSFRGGAAALAFHPSGKKLAAASLKHTVQVWEIDGKRDNHPAQELMGHFDAVTCLAYSPDGRVLATGGDDHTVRLWDAERGGERGVIELDTQVKALAFSPDGKYLYTGNGNTSCYQLDVR
jgi:WD40 repeat protein